MALPELALPDFRLETHFSLWEFAARHHLCASDAESMTLRELLEMGTDEDRAAFDRHWLGYTPTFGTPALRAAIAARHADAAPEDVLAFAGASEAIFAAHAVLLDRDAHAIVLSPNYQSHETLPARICAVTAVPLRAPDWTLDLDRVAAAIRPNTRLLTINFPHNPTGAILPRADYAALIDLCRRHGIWILHDEIFHGLGPTGTRHLPFVADLYERGLSIGVTSKSLGLPGLRVGWIVARDREILSRMERVKHYLSICNAGPAEALAVIALRNSARIVARNCAIVDEALALWDAFFAGHAERFAWRPPDGSCMAFPRYLGPEGVDAFCARAVEDAGVLLLPGSVYGRQAADAGHFRIGLGRRGVTEGLAALEAHLARL